MKSTAAWVALLLFVTIPSQLLAGVVLEMGSKNASGQESDGETIYAQSGMIRVDDIGSPQGGSMSMIFRDSQIFVLNHTEKKYHILDEATLDQIGSKMSDAMKQMQAQLANLPPEQRAMVEKMMQGQMKGMMPPQMQSQQRRVEPGGSTKWQSYSCTQYTVFAGTQKTQELCAAPPSQIEGSSELMSAFQNMAAFMEKMLESMPGPLGNLAQNPMELMNEIDGFPVHTRHFQNGQFDRETFLRSSKETSLDASMFAPPGDYKRENLMQQR